MINVFPQFSRLSLEHQSEVEQFTRQFAPYSDFNFTSLFCWDVDESIEISILNDNLVVKMPDYLTGEPVVSLLGEHLIDESLATLVKIFPQLGLVPEAVVDRIKAADAFEISDERDASDYVYRVNDVATLGRAEFKLKRKRYRRFERDYENVHLEKVELSQISTQEAIRRVFMEWAEEKMKDLIDIHHERQAVERLLTNAHAFPNMQVVIMRVDGRVTGFSINEILPNGYALCHFHKTLPSYVNIDVYLSSRTAQLLSEQGCEYLNWEQDLGIEGLRAFKLSYLPELLLRKYTLEAIS